MNETTTVEPSVPAMRAASFISTAVSESDGTISTPEIAAIIEEETGLSEIVAFLREFSSMTWIDGNRFRDLASTAAELLDRAGVPR